ncbi:hypothetical protein AGMMS50267_10230 [Spirochaetia bacterium]|nr:hypothetical protein AGMMS50267_10230 [Spirochaetia bacterium]
MSFIIALLIAALVRYLTVWIECVRMIPARTLEPLNAWVLVFRQAIPIALYCSLLLTLSYSSRRHIPIPMTIVCLFLLSVLFSLGLSLALRRSVALESPVTAAPAATLGEPGLILNTGDTTLVVLGDPAEAGSPRVVSIPGRPLFYQRAPTEPQNAVLPSTPFHTEESAVMSGMFVDFSLVAEQFASRLREGLIPFCLYLGGLCLFLASCRFVFDVTSWPLANIFLGALVFRGILIFETFLDSGETQVFITFFLDMVPQDKISPAVYCALGLIISLNTILINAARRRGGRRGE